MVLLHPISTESSNCSEQSIPSDQTSPTSPLPSILLPHLLYPPPQFPFRFQETMISTSFQPHLFYYYFYPFLPIQPYYPFPPDQTYPEPTTFSPPPPPPTSIYGGSAVQSIQPPPAPTGSRGYPNRRSSKAKRRTWYKNGEVERAKKEWMVKTHRNSGHASGPHPPFPPPCSGHLADCTTVMVRNIPNSLRRSWLINLLDRHCSEQHHKVAYDFLYIPFDFRFKQNLGYAFVNFTTGEGASTLGISWNGKGWGRNCSKITQITRAKLQGLAMCKGRFENTQFHCHSEEFLPVVFSPPRDGSNGDACTMTTVGSCKYLKVRAHAKTLRSKTIFPPRLSY